MRTLKRTAAVLAMATLIAGVAPVAAAMCVYTNDQITLEGLGPEGGTL